MERKGTPVPKPGKRNLYCSRYNDCLDYAVKALWKSWNCSQCPNRMMRGSVAEWEYAFNDADLCYDLPLDVARGFEENLFD